MNVASHHTRRRACTLTMALAIVSGLPATIALAADECVEGVDYQVVDYFKPPKSDYPKYILQGFPFSLCDGPHKSVLGLDLLTTTCENIDLKGYLHLPKGDATAHGLPLVVLSGGAMETTLKNPDVYGDACHQGRYFSEHGFAYLEIVRRGYLPSTGEYELKHTGNKLDFLANGSFEIHEAITFMRRQKNVNGEPLIDPEKVAILGHSYGAMIGLFYGEPQNLQPLLDACQCSEPLLIAKARALLAPGSLSWDGFDNNDGVLDDESAQIERLKAAARNSRLPTYFLEPLNDASTRPTVVLGKAVGDRHLAINQVCRTLVYANASTSDSGDTLARRIVDTCPLVGTEYQSALFPVVDISDDPQLNSAHPRFASGVDQIAKWGPSVLEFFARYGVK